MLQFIIGSLVLIVRKAIMKNEAQHVETHYIVLVHGTWASPEHDKPSQFRCNPNGRKNFCSLLEEKLTGYGITGAVNRKTEKINSEFLWSGDNDHIARITAAAELFEHIKKIEQQDSNARIHIVAHSHGGNVALKSLELYLKFSEKNFRSFISDFIHEMYKQEKKDSKAAFYRACDKRNWNDTNLEIPEEEFWAALTSDVKIYEDYMSAYYRKDVSGDKRWEYSLNIDNKIQKLVKTKVNHLGKFVFLGTPFLRKFWHPSKRLFLQIAVTLLEFPVFAIGLCLIIWLEIIVVWSLVWGVFGLTFGWVQSPIINPLEWSNYLLIGIPVFSVIGVLGVAFEKFSYNDLNYYFDENNVGRLHSEGANESDGDPRIKALTINARYLDEALIAMSSEPLMYSIIYPRIAEYISPPKFTKVKTEGEPAYRFVKEIIRVIWTAISYSVYWSFLFPFRKILENFLNFSMLRILQSAGYGLPGNEFKNAYVSVSVNSGVNQWLREANWDVTELLLNSEAVFSANEVNDSKVQSNAKRYAFINDGQERERSINESRIWKKVEPYLPIMLREQKHVPGITEEKLREQTKLIVLSIEKKIQEALGEISFTHSQYYMNEIVVDAVAKFIATGVIPDKATVQQGN